MQILYTDAAAETKFHHEFSACRNAQNSKRTNKVKLCRKVALSKTVTER